MRLRHSLPTWRYEGRRWDDEGRRQGLFSSIRRFLMGVWPFMASLAALSVVVSAMLVLSGFSADRAKLRAQSEALAAQTLALQTLAQDNRSLLERTNPCLPGDPLDSPPCVRKAAADAFLAQAVEQIAAGNAAENVRQHEELLAALRREFKTGRVGSGGITPRVTPLAPTTAATAPPAAPVATVPPATTTTTSCPRLPNGRCRP